MVGSYIRIGKIEIIMRYDAISAEFRWVIPCDIKMVPIAVDRHKVPHMPLVTADALDRHTGNADAVEQQLDRARIAGADGAAVDQSAVGGSRLIVG